MHYTSIASKIASGNHVTLRGLQNVTNYYLHTLYVGVGYRMKVYIIFNPVFCGNVIYLLFMSSCCHVSEL